MPYQIIQRSSIDQMCRLADTQYIVYATHTNTLVISINLVFSHLWWGVLGASNLATSGVADY